MPRIGAARDARSLFCVIDILGKIYIIGGTYLFVKGDRLLCILQKH